jgi:phospho-N-acetylmuramoyl-pentapeptide-transferase
MLYALFRYLNESFGFPLLGMYPSFRIGAAFATAFVLCLVLGKRFISWQKKRSIGEDFSKMGDARKEIVDQKKEGTPTMGGLFVGAALLISILLWCRLDSALAWTGIIVFLVFMAIGFFDDHQKLFHATKHGLSFKTKMLLTGVCATLLGIWLQQGLWSGDLSYLQSLVLPFLKNANSTDALLPLTAFGGLAFIAFLFLALAGTANGVNLADGMDGLAIGCVFCTAFALLGATYIVGDHRIASYLYVLHVPECKEISVQLGALLGGSLGFFWFNAAPAQIFMGDVGSLSLGGLLGFSAIASRMELSLLIAGGVFVAEVLSVMLQVGSFKLRGKRIFLCAPLHHHFQKMGIPETKIVARFWIVSALLAAFSLLLFKVR